LRLVSLVQEEAVRGYLKFLDDPSSAIDPKTYQDLKRKLQAATDPIEKLKLMTAIDTLAETAAELIEARFIRDAMPWAKAHGIQTKSFRALGVCAEILQRAGFTANLSDQSCLEPTAPMVGAVASFASHSVGRGAAEVSRRTNREPVRVDAVRREILGKEKVFTIREIAEGTGATVASVAKQVEVLIAARSLEDVGLITSGGRGRAPRGFRVAQRRETGKQRGSTITK
jgi:hypothetical protein